MLATTTVLCAGTIGCTEVDNPWREAPKPDFDRFVTEVQPILRDRCSFVTCHGSPDRSLTLYAVGFLRSAPAIAGTPLDEHSLTELEHVWNYDALRLRLIDEASADSSRLLLKCLDPGLGGIEHADGVVVWDDRGAPDYRTLRDWIATGL